MWGRIMRAPSSPKCAMHDADVEGPGALVACAFSDGEDRDSYYKLEEMAAKVQESDVQVFSIGFLNGLSTGYVFIFMYISCIIMVSK